MGKGGPKQVKRQRHTPEQVIRKLRVAEQMLSEGKSIGEVAKALEVSEQTLHRWRNQYGGMKAADVKRLKELEKENAQLKRLVADKELEALALKEIAKGRMKVKFSSLPRGAGSRPRRAGRARGQAPAAPPGSAPCGDRRPAGAERRRAAPPCAASSS
jgi:putative transposase